MKIRYYTIKINDQIVTTIKAKKGDNDQKILLRAAVALLDQHQKKERAK